MLIEKLAERWTITVPAKINLFLEVLGKRVDGYHDLDTVMTSVSLTDQLIFQPRNDSLITIEVRPSDGHDFQRLNPSDSAWDIPANDSNLVVRALQRLRQQLEIAKGIHVCLLKSIPAQAGLGGASADAAAAIVGGMLAWIGNYDHPVAMDLAASLGSDINFFLETAYAGSSLARCTSRGEMVEVIHSSLQSDFVIVHPPLGCSTKAIFDRLAGLERTSEAPRSPTRMLDAIAINKREVWEGEFWNRLAKPAKLDNAWVEILSTIMAKEPTVKAFSLTGSGSAVFALMKTKEEAFEFIEKIMLENRVRAYHVTDWTPAKIQQQLESILREADA